MKRFKKMLFFRKNVLNLQAIYAKRESYNEKKLSMKRVLLSVLFSFNVLRCFHHRIYKNPVVGGGGMGVLMRRCKTAQTPYSGTE